MPATFQKRRVFLVVVLVAFGLFVAGFWVTRAHHRPPALATPFQVPPEDKAAAVSPSPWSSTRNAPGQFITLDADGKFLLDSVRRRPVFISGDSAWSLQGQLSDEDVELYFADRASKGFNVIVVELVENYYSNHPPHDYYGNVPFNGDDFTNENPAYWLRVDQTISRAAAHGITLLADPAFVGFDCKGTKGGYCESYRRASKEVVTNYGRFLGARYKGVPNLIWLIGGDANPEDADLQSKLYALAKGIRSEDSVHLMTTENFRGTSSADIWSEASWLDLNALYLKPDEILAKTSAEYTESIHPMFLLEDWYEGSHLLTDSDIRKEGYWAVLAGNTLGHVFGNYAIWNFSWNTETRDPWKSQLDSIGSNGQAILGRLFRSREHWKLVPDLNHTVLTAGYDPRSISNASKESMRSWLRQAPYRLGNMAAVAARTSDGQTIIVYVPGGSSSPISMDMSKIEDSASQAKCWWFNPRTGSAGSIGIFPAQGTRQFTPPDKNDWVLVIDSTTANLAAPGRKDL
jgi:hypothetical protein